MKILIIKLSSLGDVIHTLPVLTPLKKTFPQASITWLVEPESSQLLYDHPLVDRVLIFPKNHLRRVFTSPRCFKAIPAFVRELRADSYDVVLDFQGLLKSGILTGLTRAREKRGFYPGREQSHHFLTHKLPVPPGPVHSVDRYLTLVESLGCQRSRPEFPVPIRQLHRSAVWSFFVTHGITGDRPLVLLHPGTRWQSKMWPEQRWTALADMLHSNRNCDIVFTGTGQERQLLERIIEAAAVPAINSAGCWSLNELAFLHTQAAAVVTPDSGPMHLAAGLGTAVVALFGPTDPRLTGPYGTGHTVLTRAVECRPCFKRRCPSPRCMTDITPDEVCTAVSRYVQRDVQCIAQ